MVSILRSKVIISGLDHFSSFTVQGLKQLFFWKAVLLKTKDFESLLFNGMCSKPKHIVSKLLLIY